MLRSLQILALVVSIMGGWTNVFGSPQLRSYSRPESMQLRIVLKPGGSSEELHFEAAVQMLAGSLVDAKITFVSSKDLTISPGQTKIPELAQGQEFSMPFVATRKGGAQLSLDSWVGVQITYLPDWTAMEKLARDEKRYPVDHARLNLLRSIRESQANHEELTQDGRYFLTPSDISSLSGEPAPPRP